jgi:5'-phosphate synthase pdxT subunit
VGVRRAGDLQGLDGLVLPGGESTAIGRLLQVFDLLEPLREAVHGGLPTYGSCAGMVLLATDLVDGMPGQPVLGGLDVSVRRNAFGSQVESFEADLPLSGVGEAPVHGVFIRAPWVERTGEGVEVLARVPAGAPAAGRVVAVRQGQVLATAFHPELTGDTRVHRLFVDMVKEATP